MASFHLLAEVVIGSELVRYVRITYLDKSFYGLKGEDEGNVTDPLANLTEGLVLECVRQINNLHTLGTVCQMNKICSDWFS